jgi:anhydro-N-acetylmuramic acid kinase
MKIIGLMSGTSMDGITAALVEVHRRRSRVQARVLHFRTYPYSRFTVELIREASDAGEGSVNKVDKIARLNYYLGELFADAALSLLSCAGVKPRDVSLIGSHGQTIHHLPRPKKMGKHRVRATMQIGEPAVIAARTGITTVADFRAGDVAAGGEGAPLVPYVDFLLFQHPDKNRLILNIGGIANLTLLPAGNQGLEGVMASDTGPGNMVIDELVQRMTKGRKRFDKDGELAAAGIAREQLLREILRHPFFRRKPPRSCGREEFGPGFTADLIRKAKPRTLSQWKNLIATATALSVESIHLFCRKFLPERFWPEEIIASGGGVKNMTLMSLLAERFSSVPIVFPDNYGIPAEAKEAMAFAVLAYEAYHSRPCNVPGATGAKGPAILGKIVPALAWRVNGK